MNPNRFSTKVNGIPCTVVVTHYRAGKPPTLAGPMEDADEGEDEEFDYYIVDHRNIRDAWIESQADYDQILEEFHVTRLEFKHYIED